MKVCKPILTLIATLLLQVSSAQFTGFRKLDDPAGKFENSFEVVMNPFAEDSLGNIWIASKSGLCKYNGSKTTCFSSDREDLNSPSGNDLEGMLMDSDNQIWIACKGYGIDVFDLQMNKKIHLKHVPNDPSTLLSNRVWGMFEDDLGFVWISYYTGGISAYSKETGTIQHYDFDSIVSDTITNTRTVGYFSKHETEKDVMWLSTTYGLVKWNTKTRTGSCFQFYSEYDAASLKTEHNDELLSSNHHRIMYKDQEGILWMGSFGGIVRFDPTSEEHQVIFEGESDKIENTVGIHKFDDSNLMIASNSGIHLLNKETFTITKLSEKYPNSGQSYLTGRMFEASNGCIYLASVGNLRGIYRWCDSHELFSKTFIKSNTHEVIETEHFLHYSVKKGIVSKNLHTNKITQHNYKQIEPSIIRAIQPLNGDSLLVATTLEAYYYHPSTGITPIKELSKKGLFRFESIFKTKDGRIWSGRQREGLFLYNPTNGNEELINFEKNQLPDNNYVEDLFEDSEGDLWISTEGGWSMFDRSTDSFHVCSSQSFARAYDINVRAFNAITQTPDNKIWIFDQKEGVVIWDKSSDRLDTFLLYDNFRINGVTDASIDSYGNVWLVNSSQEVAKINYETREVTAFIGDYGIEGPLYSINRGSSGKMYIGSTSGFYEFDPLEVSSFATPVGIPLIEGFEIFDANKDSLLQDSMIKLEHNENFFSFDVTSINYKNPTLDIYEVRLSPFDKEWQKLGEKRYKGYTNVPAGSYTFDLRVKTASNSWNYANPVKLKINAIWYNTLLFKILSIGLFFSLLWYYFRWRRKNAIRKAETEKQLSDLNMKALRAQMNPHFLFNSLNSIRYQILSNDKQKAANYLTKFSRLVRYILQNSEQEFVSLADELYLMQLYIDMEQIRFVDKFDFVQEIAPELEQSKVLIPPMIIQPFLENAIIHGINPLERRGLLTLKIYKEIDRIHIIVQDNGIGIQASKKLKGDTMYKKSMGMDITKNRIEIFLDSSVVDHKLIEDLYDENGNPAGTKVHFSLPVKA